MENLDKLKVAEYAFFIIGAMGIIKGYWIFTAFVLIAILIGVYNRKH